MNSDEATTLRAEKFAIAISRNPQGKYTLQVLGINGDRVVSSVPELEESGIGFSTASRVVERVWHTIKLRLNRGLLEFVTDDPTNGTATNGRPTEQERDE